MNHRIIISNWDPNQPLDLNLPLDFDEPDEPDPDPPDPPDPSPDQPASSS